MNKNKNKLCCTTSSKSKSSISSLSFRYLPCLMINKELVNTHLSTFEHSNLTRNDQDNSTWPHLNTESLTLALIQHHGFFEKQWTCLVFNEALGPRNIKVNGGHFRRCVKLNSGSFLQRGWTQPSFFNTNSEARANSDIWHEFWSTCEFWHLTRILKHVQILTPDTNSEARANSEIWHLTRILKHVQILTPL